jgi:hypothetical protein
MICFDFLMGRYGFNTAPLETLDAYRDHGVPKARASRNSTSRSTS